MGAAAALVAVGLSVTKFATLDVPVWRIRVVDQRGAPVPHARVREIWQNYSLESEAHEQDCTSDESGYVEFPARYARGSAIRRAWGPVRSLLQQGIHASFGPDAYVMAITDSAEGSAGYKPGVPPPAVISLRPRPSY